MTYIAELQNSLVGRVRTHGEKSFKRISKNNKVSNGINEKSLKEEIIKVLHKLVKLSCH